ncbi:MAG: preprotein translocase subunit SecA, partial [Gammaproteobacteria bacterium]|nr:preprotein translocase subunit SecA [Gammaproteobacteria bacterium]
VSRAIAGAQKKVEQYNFDIRKQLLQYDNVANDQRSVIYRERNELLAAQTISEAIDRMIRDVVTQFARTYIPLNTLEEQWDLDGLEAALHADFNLKLPVKTWLQEDDSLEDESLIEKITEAVFEHYDSKRRELPENLKNQLEKTVLLQSLDGHWREHLSNMDHLRQSIHLRGYAQKDPKQEFKRESFELFSRMLDSFKYEVITTLVKVQIKQPEEVSRAESEWRKTAGTLNFQHADLNLIGSAAEAAPDKTPAPMMGDFPQLDRPANDVIEPFSYQGAKVGRNDPCPCGSGKKFKQCHGQIL